MQPLSREKQQQQPGVIASLMAGFDLVTRHLWLILLPLILDVLYWLGPRLSIENLAQRSAEVLRLEQSFIEMSEQLVQISTQVNLFTAISVPLIGVPALMNGPIPEETPIASSVYQVDGPYEWILIFLGLSLVGLFLAAFNLSLISKTITENDSWQRDELWHLAKSTIQSTYRLIGLGFLFLIALIIVLLPLMPVALLLSFLGNGLYIIVFLLGFALVATYFCLAVPGIIFRRKALIPAVSESIRLVHRNLLSTVNILVLILLIGNGMNLLWHMADDGSWLTLISIAGHAFIGTALVATFIIYYRNRSEVLLEELR
jgi:hypothetical protein